MTTEEYDFENEIIQVNRKQLFSEDKRNIYKNSADWNKRSSESMAKINEKYSKPFRAPVSFTVSKDLTLHSA